MQYEGSNENSFVGNVFTFERLKVMVAIIVAYFITTSSMYVDLVLSKVPGALDGGKFTDKGCWINAILIVIIYFLADLASKANLI